MATAKSQKGMHKMPDGSMMKDSDHKSSYGHGGVVKANCGASMKATQGKKK
jgi:hypothetical protein|tara:strand:+ start:474 stop:626 length:153 start_codon:yes stop_codon:yes gene_type:complete